MTSLNDTLLVSISFSDKDTGVLVVGRKRKNQSIEIINVYSHKPVFYKEETK